MGQVVPLGSTYVDGLRQVQASIKNLVEDALPNINKGTRQLGNDS